ncbi:uncharacterized protein J4E84_008216 [Alternaria hordeiaustralica]|uniref:uncharacterized protein n=1 Tax=Alternaria hordeiaustralica TaxID=1187925 RepID=UPI0020C4E391|nr:uncharacterized protein J4E84_008216 [Alternaria hordeiaustralica]KAI4679694.1 hypothetical protein J4E84_008216 [Alternaria hordeiaustralica]
MSLSELTEQQRATIGDRARVWEVRRFCQVLPSVVKYVRGSDAGLTSRPLEPHGRYVKNEPDGALAALLRCVIHQTGADLAMVSLLDDHTQYFISGASRANADEAKVTLEDSTRWYGCESVTHHGGLCERTITRQNEPGGSMALYEELDMAELERTKHLPFVQGDIAKFRHYAGVPLNPYGGPNIGTVFTFSSTPSQGGLSDAHRSYLFETASHIIRHLEQAVEALEGKRVLKFNQGVASLLKMGTSAGLAAQPAHKNLSSGGHTEHEVLVSNLYPAAALQLYHLSATLLYDTFEFDGVRIQELGSSSNKNPIWNGSNVLAEHLGPKAHRPQELSHSLTSRLLELFPHGAVFQLLNDTSDIVVATSADDVALVEDTLILKELSKTFLRAEQIVLMPLWDAFHERNIGAVLGFAENQSREDPIAEGTGLGLSIVKQTVTMLSGDVQIESNKKEGSTFTVTLPSSQALYEAPEEASESSNLQAGTAELHQLDMSLFTPTRWRSGDSLRDQRCTDLLLGSLAKSLSRWFHIRVIPWESASRASPWRLLVVLEEDEDSALRACGGASDDYERIRLCPDVQTAPSQYSTPLKGVATIAGAVTSSKIQDALAHLYPSQVPPSELRHNSDQESVAKIYDQQQPVEGSRSQLRGDATDECRAAPTALLSRLELERSPQLDGEESGGQPLAMPAASPAVTPEMNMAARSNGAQPDHRDVQAHTEQAKEAAVCTSPEAAVAEPRLLLVDDNAVNLKVLAMYAKKCSKAGATPVGGGQEAIDAFKNANGSSDDTGPQPFDLIFLDLSMPEVSGFEVAREIRKTEARSGCKRTYICALTGLVSEKDRNAAYASGVDNYLVRPTRLQDLQGVIEMWRDKSSEK